jgi:DNA-binding HxlR family transcriptional regulator
MSTDLFMRWSGSIELRLVLPVSSQGGKYKAKLAKCADRTMGLWISKANPYMRVGMTQIPLARRSPIPPDTCNLASAIEVVGDRWTLLILRAALYGVRRFDDFQAELKCPRTVLSGRLRSLVDAGLLVKRPYKAPGKRARPEYLLSAMGLSLRPILIGLTQWGDAWLAAGETPPISFTKAGTKSAIRAAFVDADGREVRPDQIRTVIRG